MTPTSQATYSATVRHHSIGAHRSIQIHGTIAQAKRRASAEFGDSFLDHTLVIYEHTDTHGPVAVSTRRIGARRWTDVL